MPGVAKRLARRCLPDPIYASYKRRQWLHETSRYEPRTVSHSYAGVPLEVAIEDPMASAWYEHDWPEIPELEILERNGLGPGSLLFDLGAHQAVVALVAAKHSARVVAVEAERHNVRVARKNVEANQPASVTVVHAAASDSPGTIRFVEGLNGSARPGQFALGVKTPAVTVDELARRHGHPSAVLIDVEGAEAKVLAGAGKTLERGAMFVVEIHAGVGLEAFGATAADVLAFFDGYELLVFDDEDPVWRPPDGAIDRRAFLFARRG